jgi:hypothetical protein
MFLQITFKAFPKTHFMCAHGTFYLPVHTISVMFNDVFNEEHIQAAAQAFKARELLSSGDVFQSHIRGP